MNSFFLSHTPIFHSIREDEIIFRAGSPITETGLILSGSVNSIVNLYWGNSHIFGHFSKGQVFGESYAAIPGRELICDIVACEETRGPAACGLSCCRPQRHVQRAFQNAERRADHLPSE